MTLNDIVKTIIRERQLFTREENSKSKLTNNMGYK